MAPCSSPRRAGRRSLAAAALVVLTAAPAWAQTHAGGGSPYAGPCPFPSTPPSLPGYPGPSPYPGLWPSPGQYPGPGQAPEPGTGGQPGAPPEAGTTPTAQPGAAPGFNVGGETGRAGTAGTTSLAYALKGDLLGIPALAFLPPSAFGRGVPTESLLAPSVRSFKLSDNQDPAPQDRVYTNFNYFDNVAADIHRRLGIDLRNIQVYRETFGVEKTFCDQNVSVSVQAPLNTLSADSFTPSLGGTDTAMGDVTGILKFIICADRESGSLLSGGVAVTAPTGPGHFADSSVPVLRDTLIQPFLGYRLGMNRAFLHGFLSVEVPTDSRDVTFLFNDVGVGYVVCQKQEGVLTAVVPTFEVHVTDPLNHRGIFRSNDPFAAADIIDLTGAVTFELCGHARLALGAVVPVTGPRPFDVEGLAQFTWLFGARGVDGRSH
jgi:hypothetical protein